MQSKFPEIFKDRQTADYGLRTKRRTEVITMDKVGMNAVIDRSHYACIVANLIACASQSTYICVLV